ncbi:MAG: hypothetical protein ACRD22_08215 [Terriglobia bacterium]
MATNKPAIPIKPPVFMTSRHRLIYGAWGVIGAAIVWIVGNSHSILPLIPAHYQGIFTAIITFLITVRALNQTPPEKQ